MQDSGLSIPVCSMHAEFASQIKQVTEGQNLIKESIDALSKKIDDNEMITVVNGTEKTIPRNIAFQEIWSVTQFSRDRKKIFNAFKLLSKYQKTNYVIRRIIFALSIYIVLLHYFGLDLNSIIKFFLGIK